MGDRRLTLLRRVSLVALAGSAIDQVGAVARPDGLTPR